MESIKGKNVLIVGATGSIGMAVTRYLSEAGAILFLLGRNAESLRTLADDCDVPLAHIFPVDLTQYEEVKSAARDIHAIVPAIDVIINAAGVGIIKPFENLSVEDFDTSINVNLKGSFYILKEFLPAMKEQKKGLIIHIPGILGKTPMAGASLYAASKYGLNGMMKSLREELKRTDIRVTQLFLGGVDSRFWDTIDLRVQREKMIMADEAAKAIVFLCQQPSSGVVSEMVIQPFNHQAI
jgi:short-subunit dehydrogenase